MSERDKKVDAVNNVIFDLIGTTNSEEDRKKFIKENRSDDFGGAEFIGDIWEWFTN